MNRINAYMERLHHPDLGRLLLRLSLGIVFINAGWMKIGMMDLVVAGFASMGIPTFFAYVVSYAEFIGGILLILGVFTRVSSLVLAFIMFVAMVKVHWAAGYSIANNGYEYVLMLMLALLALATLGGGKYSIRRFFKRS